MHLPIFDLHCDLLSYLAKIPGASPSNENDIACALPWLRKGNVQLQVLAIYTDVRAGSMDLALKQAEIFQSLTEEKPGAFSAFQVQSWKSSDQIAALASIENAAGLGEENASWEAIERQLDEILSKVGRLAYVSLTHHTENRFGGGNYTEGIGLKDDGRRLLDLLIERNIPIDLSHSSDLLAEGILNHIDQHQPQSPIIASHSNYRATWDHVRNLSDEFAQEIIRRKGIIGVNFLRAFLDNDVPERLFEHILHGFQIGGENAQSFGADYFYTQDFPDKSRHPFYFHLAENASKYPEILDVLAENLSAEQLEKLAYKNVLHFYQNIFS
jgi:microsomal dipeptidase-like Zn-dependent dipeptidase